MPEPLFPPDLTQQAIAVLDLYRARGLHIATAESCTGGLIAAEAVMMGLAPKLGRQSAHDLVYECCRTSLEGGREFLDVLADHPDIGAVMDRDRLSALVDPANYVGSAPEMVDRYLAMRAVNGL